MFNACVCCCVFVCGWFECCALLDCCGWFVFVCVSGCLCLLCVMCCVCCCVCVVLFRVMLKKKQQPKHQSQTI